MRCIDIRALVTLEVSGSIGTLRQKELDAALLAGGARMGLGAYDGSSIRRGPSDTALTALNWGNFDPVIDWLLDRDLTIVLVLGSDAPKWDAYRLSLPGPPAAWVEPTRPPAAAYPYIISDHNAVMARMVARKASHGSSSRLFVQPAQEAGKGGAAGPWTTSNGNYAAPFDVLNEGEWEGETDAPGRSILGFLEYWGDNAVVPDGIEVILPSFECDMTGFDTDTGPFIEELLTFGANMPASLADKVDYPGFNMYVGTETAYLTGKIEQYGKHYFDHCEIAREEIRCIVWGTPDYLAPVKTHWETRYLRTRGADSDANFALGPRLGGSGMITVTVRLRARGSEITGVTLKNGGLNGINITPIDGGPTFPEYGEVGSYYGYVSDWSVYTWEFDASEIEDWDDVVLRIYDPGNSARIDVSRITVTVDGEDWPLLSYAGYLDAPWTVRGGDWAERKMVITECGSTLAKLGWNNVILPGFGWAVQGVYDLHVINLLDASGLYEVISHYVSRERSVVADSASFGLMLVDGTYTARYRAYARASGDYSDVPPGGGSYSTTSGETVTEVQS